MSLPFGLRIFPFDQIEAGRARGLSPRIIRTARPRPLEARTLAQFLTADDARSRIDLKAEQLVELDRAFEVGHVDVDVENVFDPSVAASIQSGPVVGVRSD